MAYNDSPHDQAGAGAMAVGVLASNPETKIALRLSDDGRLMVEVAGLAIDADIIDLDMDAITGAPPNSVSLYDLWELLQTISGGTNLSSIESLLGDIKSDTGLIDSDVIGIIQSLSVGSDLVNQVATVENAVYDIGGGADLAMVDGELLRCADSLWAISQGDQVGLGDVWMAVEALGGGADLNLVDGDVLRCADSLWTISAGDSVSLQAVVDAVNDLRGVDNRTLTDLYNALTTP